MPWLSHIGGIEASSLAHAPHEPHHLAEEDKYQWQYQPGAVGPEGLAPFAEMDAREAPDFAISGQEVVAAQEPVGRVEQQLFLHWGEVLSHEDAAVAKDDQAHLAGFSLLVFVPGLRQPRFQGHGDGEWALALFQRRPAVGVLAALEARDAILGGE